MSKPNFTNPISPALRPIPSYCPICQKPQWNGHRAVNGAIEDAIVAGEQTVAHTKCIHWYNQGS